MSYKINQSIKSYDIVDSDFTEKFSRLNDNSELGLRGVSENFYIAQVISGNGMAPVGDNQAISNQPNLVDLGDGIKRFAVKVRLIGDVFFPSPTNNSFTNLLTNPLSGLSEPRYPHKLRPSTPVTRPRLPQSTALP